jgi:methanogenic corrinoid protein MtbC1
MANDQLINATADLDEDLVHTLTDQGLKDGLDPNDLLADCQAGLEIVGQRFEEGDYYLSDLMLAGEIFRTVADKLSESSGGTGPGKGKVIIGTVQGDIHNIGKDLVVTMLQAARYDVEDLGVDVPPDVFVDRIKDSGATVVGMSGLITIAYDSMKEVVEKLEAQGLRDKVKVMIGGGPITEQVRQYVGADSFGNDAHSAVAFADQWITD